MQSPMHMFYRCVNVFSLAFFPVVSDENLCEYLYEEKNRLSLDNHSQVTQLWYLLLMMF